QQAVRGQQQRDLVIKLAWVGEADLDLKVKEPTGSVCSALVRQTVGGGVLIGDTLLEQSSETYLAAEAFSGADEGRVERVWGRSLGDKAQLRIIRHQGSAEESEQLVTVNVKANEVVKVKLANGRRTETAHVAPTASLETPTETTTLESKERTLSKLRALSDP